MRTWVEVGQVITERMAFLGKSQTDIAHLSGLSNTKIRQLERGLPPLPRASTRSKFCLALGWVPDALDQLLNGADPASVVTKVPLHIGINGELPRALEVLPAQVSSNADRLTRIEAQLSRIEALLDAEDGVA